MRLFLIRHAETVDNVAQVLAGTTDSALTNHGAVQIERLAQHFKSEDVAFTRVYSSDLSRAAHTAAGICAEQPASTAPVPLATPLLRERHFGSIEGKTYSALYQSGTVDRMPESDDSVTLRANSFINDHLLPLVFDDLNSPEVVAVVSHGIVLRFLWRALAALFDPRSVRMAPDIRGDTGGATFSPVWSNTGFMEVVISAGGEASPEVATGGSQGGTGTAMYPLSGWLLDVRVVNSKTHLADLRRVQGGIGSAAFDQSQRRIDTFFKK